jgi:hypothetical protein
MIESSHTLLLSFRGNFLWVLAFLGMVNPLGFLAPDIPKPEFLKVGTRLGS